MAHKRIPRMVVAIALSAFFVYRVVMYVWSIICTYSDLLYEPAYNLYSGQSIG